MNKRQALKYSLAIGNVSLLHVVGKEAAEIRCESLKYSPDTGTVAVSLLFSALCLAKIL